MGSLTCCMLALLFQIIYTWHMVDIGDFSALMDTTWAVALVSGFLVLTTLGVNGICGLIYRRETHPPVA